jgi:hypothetical protein
MLEPETEAPKRTKPSDVALAEHQAWKQGIVAAQELADHCVRVRYNLLALGFPDAHALCQDIDKDAAKWAGMAIQMRRSMVKHAEANQIQV